MLSELRYAVRGLVRSPGSTLVAVATLALGLGSAAGLGAYASALLWPRLDAPDPDRIVRLDGADGMERSLRFSYPDLLDYRQRSHTLEHLSAYSIFGAMIELGGTAQHGWAQSVSGDFFELFGARPRLGRLLTRDDERPEAPPVVVLGSFFWRYRLGADPEIVGKRVSINGQRATVVGVVEKGFQGLIPGAVYVPASMHEAVTGNVGQLLDRQRRWLAPVARLAPGGSVEGAVGRATQELNAIARSLDESHPRPVGTVGKSGSSRASSSGRRVTVIPVLAPDPFDNRLNRAAEMLLTGAVVLLLLACANVANLVLARAAATRRQLGVQAALGAARVRLAARRSVEGALLVLAALPFALALGQWLALLMERYAMSTPVGLGDWAPGFQLVRFDAGACGLTLALALVAVVSVVAAPSLQALRLDLASALRADASGSSGGGLRGLRQILVVVQVALASLLLIGAGLLGRSLWQASSVEPGFDADGLVLATLFVPRTVGLASDTEDSGTGSTATGRRDPIGRRDPPALTFYRALLERARRFPGVRSAALARNAPLGGLGILQVATVEAPEKRFEASTTIVSPGYFEVLGLDLVAGRGFGVRDRRDAPGAVVVSRSFAETHLDGAVSSGQVGASPVGRSLLLPEEDEESVRSFEIVGVVEDARLGTLLEPPRPTVFLPFEQHLRPRMHLLMRIEGPLAPIASGLRRWLRDHPLKVGLIGIAPFEAQERWALFYPRMNAWMAALCGIAGLVLAVTGVGSVMAYSVTRRRREMGIRQALGATPRAVRRLAHREALRLVGLGLLVGVGGGLAAARWLASLLYGVEPWDPWIFTAVPLGLLAAAVLAADLPARRGRPGRSPGGLDGGVRGGRRPASQTVRKSGGS